MRAIPKVAFFILPATALSFRHDEIFQRFRLLSSYKVCTREDGSLSTRLNVFFLLFFVLSFDRRPWDGFRPKIIAYYRFFFFRHRLPGALTFRRLTTRGASPSRDTHVRAMCETLVYRRLSADRTNRIAQTAGLLRASRLIEKC